MNKEIRTEIEEAEGPFDDGVAQEFVATEEYSFHGEHIERETTFALLEDGSVHIAQKVENQGIYDTATVSSEILNKINQERDNNDE